MNCCCRQLGPTYPLMRRVRDGALQTFSSDFVRNGKAVWNGELWVNNLSARNVEVDSAPKSKPWTERNVGTNQP